MSANAPRAGTTKRAELIGLDRLDWEFTSWRKEWEYLALAAVETALFAHEWEGL